MPLSDASAWDFFMFGLSFKTRHVQLPTYAVFHAESEAAVGIDKFFHQEDKNKRSHFARVSISYRQSPYLSYVSTIGQPTIYVTLKATMWPNIRQNVVDE